MDIEEIVRQVMEEMTMGDKQESNERRIPLEISARHCHLSAEHIEILFGHDLEAMRDLSQLGQYLSKQRIRVVGPKGVIDNIAVLGPARAQSQVEVSATDARALGIPSIVRQSGDTAGSAPILITNGEHFVHLTEGVIVASNHVHMNPDDAKRLGLKDKEFVHVQTETARPLIFSNVLVRVHETFVLNMHIDFDEANACLATMGSTGIILDKPSKASGDL